MRFMNPEEIFQAGWDDGADDAPLTREEIERLAVLHGPHLTITAEAS